MTKDLKMIDYYILPLETEDHDFIWCVMETTTEQLIEAFEFEDEAQKYAKFLDRGGGFAGWTPSFILQEVVNRNTINQKFSEFIAE